MRFLLLNCTAKATWKYGLLSMMWLEISDDMFYVKMYYKL